MRDKLLEGIEEELYQDRNILSDDRYEVESRVLNSLRSEEIQTNNRANTKRRNEAAAKADFNIGNSNFRGLNVRKRQINGKQVGRNGSTALTDDAVLTIRREHKAGVKQCVLAKKHGRSAVTINKIVHRQSYTHLPKE